MVKNKIIIWNILTFDIAGVPKTYSIGGGGGGGGITKKNTYHKLNPHEYL